MNRCLLLHMPFGSVHRPSIALSLLKASLEEAGFGCEIRYVNQTFASMLGLELYEFICRDLPQELLFGELIFASTLFPGPRDLQEVQRQFPSCPAWFFEALPWLQSTAERFLQQLVAEIPWHLYRLVGFGSMFHQMVSALSLARRIKARPGGPPVVLGGANCEDQMGETLHRNFPWVDFICRAEGERLIVDLMRHLCHGSVELGQIGGLSWRSGERSIHNPMAEPTADMDALPTPQYHDWLAQLGRSHLPVKPSDVVLPFETSRGCWYGAKAHCTFCGLNGQTMAYRSKSPERVLRELEGMKAYGIPSLHVVDNILDFKYFKTLLPRLAEAPHGMSFFFEVKSNLSREQLQLMKAAGIDGIQPGIESLSTPVLQLMRKGVSALQNVRLLKWSSELRMLVHWNLLYGFDGEDPAEYQRMAELVPLLVHLSPPTYGCCRARVDRFSPMYRALRERGDAELRPMASYRAVYPLPAEELRGLAYYFETAPVMERDPEQYLGALKRQVSTWQALAGKVTFCYVDGGQALQLLDTRPVARMRDALLTGLERDLFLACEAGASLERLCERLPAPQPTVQRLVAEFVARRWLVELDGQYLHLAVSARPSLASPATGPSETTRPASATGRTGDPAAPRLTQRKSLAVVSG